MNDLLVKYARCINLMASETREHLKEVMDEIQRHPLSIGADMHSDTAYICNALNVSLITSWNHRPRSNKGINYES